MSQKVGGENCIFEVCAGHGREAVWAPPFGSEFSCQKKMKKSKNVFRKVWKMFAGPRKVMGGGTLGHIGWNFGTALI